MLQRSTEYVQESFHFFLPCSTHAAASCGWTATRMDSCEQGGQAIDSGRINLGVDGIGIGDRVRKKCPMGSMFSIANVLPRPLVLRCIALARFFLARHRTLHLHSLTRTRTSPASPARTISDEKSCALCRVLRSSIILSVCPTNLNSSTLYS